jgi:hypothetical protein
MSVDALANGVDPSIGANSGSYPAIEGVRAGHRQDRSPPLGIGASDVPESSGTKP